jgi:hypothetical protein
VRYLKLLPPVLGVLITVLISILSDGKISNVELLQLLIAVAQTLAVGLGGLLSAGVVWPKTALAAVLAGLQLIMTYVTAHGSLGAITLSEWLNVLLSIAVVAGVAVIPPRTAVAAPPDTP